MAGLRVLSFVRSFRRKSHLTDLLHPLFKCHRCLLNKRAFSLHGIPTRLHKKIAILLPNGIEIAKGTPNEVELKGDYFCLRPCRDLGMEPENAVICHPKTPV
jgi:hypothetical protein